MMVIGSFEYFTLNLLQLVKSSMATALISNCDWGGRDSYSRHQPSRSPRHDQYENSG